jgi:NADH dehydrogenase [ubiquinone] 1 alpha subcomplex assembly factor 7
MRQCLTSPEGGYYTRAYTDGRDPFGIKGDFVTAPEISQIFGELLGLWMVTEWMAQGRRSKGLQLIEMGPGRGTLMDDMLRTMQSFPPLAEAIDEIYMIEASTILREKQHRLLCGDNPLESTDIGHTSKTKHKIPVRIHWVTEMNQLPEVQTTDSPFFVAHEFFDAMPIHVFTTVTSPSTNLTGPNGQHISAVTVKQWRELLVDVASHPSSPIAGTSSIKTQTPDFALTMAKAPTPHSQLLPTLLPPRYSKLLSLPAGTTIEISPESITYASEIAKRIGRAGAGAAMIMDYGPSDSIVPSNSLRGIQSHRLVSPFWGAGNVDLSASVDFGALAAAALDAHPGVEVHGHVRQATFLRNMGGQERCEILAKNVTKLSGEEGGKRVREGFERLVDQGVRGMGRLFQVLGIVPEGRGKKGGVVGFGGDVVG